MTSRICLLVKTSLRLGLGPVARVAAYRFACKSGLYRRLLPQKQWEGDREFFVRKPGPLLAWPEAQRPVVLERAHALLEGEMQYFSDATKKVGAPPDWFLDPFSATRLASAGHWSDCREFSGGDIKNVWEASRFEWAPTLALAWRLDRDDRFSEALNDWVSDWVDKNPANTGPNWKCGQESSIRLINMLLAARLLLNHNDPAPALVRLVALHCSRILRTLRYAVAQDNNHGTSEAAALYIGGGWLLKVADCDSTKRRAARWHECGRRWLEERVAALVAEDGSFSQYSVNYHRVLLDTLCQVENWRRELGAAPMSDLYNSRCRAATAWLAAMTDPGTGGAPNLGANDGARLYDLSFAPYSDFRPSVQLATLLFWGRRAFASRQWDGAAVCQGMDTAVGTAPEKTGTKKFNDGGYVLLSSRESRGLTRFASFRFRPGHADCLHVDLWHKGRCILRDGGTFSYNTEPRWYDYFSGGQSHNTVQFDDWNQMPRIGRFLFGEWLAMEECSPIGEDGDELSWSGAYRDWKGCRHRRTVSAKAGVWLITDEISGFKEKAVLRWRLIPTRWQLLDTVCHSPYAEIKIATSAPVRRLELADGWESLHYQRKTQLPVLEVEFPPGEWKISTEIILKD